MKKHLTPSEAGVRAAQIARKTVDRALKYAGASVRKTVNEIALIAYSDITDYYQVDAAGSLKPLPWEKLKNTKAIKKIREKRKILSGAANDTILEDSLEFELYDKLDALKLLSALQDLKPPEKMIFPDEEGKPQRIDSAIFSDPERAARLVYLVQQAQKRAEAQK